MRQLKAEYYKMKYSRASKWVLVFMAFIFFIPFVVGNDTLFMTFGDYRNIDSIGWICYIDDMNNVKAAEIARFALSINFFSWIGLIVYITTMVSAEFHQGTIRASVVYGINRTKLFLSKLLVINVHFFILYYIVETALGLSAKEYDVLIYLAKNQGKILTKKQIYENVWNEEYVYDDDNIMAVISRLRKKIERTAENSYIQTVRGLGYRFNKEL